MTIPSSADLSSSDSPASAQSDGAVAAPAGVDGEGGSAAPATHETAVADTHLQSEAAEAATLGSDIHSGEMHGYDGHVALALDAAVLPDIGSTLDLLTQSHDLFDVPALDFGSSFDDAAGT